MRRNLLGGALAPILVSAFALAACEPAPRDAPGVDIGPRVDGVEAPLAPGSALPEVDAALLAAPITAFVAVEPTDIGVIGAPDVREAIAPLISVEALGEGETVQLTVRETGDAAVADIVRSGLQDDAVIAGHVRIEFRREEDGWFPTNAYRRHQCRRGALAMQWTTDLCP